jgi:hypothetical protein
MWYIPSDHGVPVEDVALFTCDVNHTATQLYSTVRTASPLPTLVPSTAVVCCKHPRASSNKVGSPWSDGVYMAAESAMLVHRTVLLTKGGVQQTRKTSSLAKLNHSCVGNAELELQKEPEIK